MVYQLRPPDFRTTPWTSDLRPVNLAESLNSLSGLFAQEQARRQQQRQFEAGQALDREQMEAQKAIAEDRLAAERERSMADLGMRGAALEYQREAAREKQ